MGRHNPTPVRAEPVEALHFLLFLRLKKEEGQGFDKLSPNEVEVIPEFGLPGRSGGPSGRLYEVASPPARRYGAPP